MKNKILFIFICVIFSCCALSSCGGSSIADTMPPEMAKNMIKLKGYDFNEKGYFQAIRNDDVGILNAFYDAKMPPATRNEKGETPLTFAIRNSQLKTIKFLADNTDISEPDALGQSPLHFSLSQNKEDAFNYLLEKGANVNSVGTRGRLKNQTVLYLALTLGRKDIVQRLLELGADPEIADGEGGTVLTESCIGTLVDPELTKTFIEKGANVNQKETNGATPLIYIAANNQTSSDNRKTVIKMLLDAGADKKAKDHKGETAFDWAKDVGNKDVLDLLK